MTLATLAIYSLTIATLLAVGAWLLERSLLSLRLNTRWVWVCALVLSVGLPLNPFPADRQGVGSLRIESVERTLVTGEPGKGTVAPESPQFDIMTALQPLLGLGEGLNLALKRGAALLPGGTLSDSTIGTLWAGTSILMAVLLGGSMMRLRRQIRSFPSETVLGRKVKVSPGLGPATVGALAPLVVIPRWARELPAHELELILRHEMEHVRSRDTLLLSVALAAVVVYPWNPLLWWQLRRLKDAVELDCDRRLFRSGVAPAQYGDLLLTLGSSVPRTSLLLSRIVGSPSLLERRIRIMKSMREGVSVPRVVAAAAVALLLVGVACTTDAPMATDEQAGSGPSPIAATATASEFPDDLVDVRVDRDGGVHLNGAALPLHRLGATLAATYEDHTVVSVHAHEAAPYGLIAALQDQLREAGLLRVVFGLDKPGAEAGPPTSLSAVVEAGFATVLPPASAPQMGPSQIPARNLLDLEVLPAGIVAVRVGGGSPPREITPREVEALWRREHALNSNLVAVLKTHQTADYRHMYEVLGALQRAEATRWSFQVVEP